jgi:D-beta-D-heptose 7-phosphate kinase/D-beta-D-heptose 1-phosphate adenosyltransferase
MTSVYIGNLEPNVIIIGDIILDHNLEGHSTKIANEGPIPVINICDENYGIGGCGNVLMNVAALGAKKIFIFSRVGNDNNGAKLIKLLPTITTNNIIIDDIIPTITKTRIYSDKKIMARYDKEHIKDISVEQELIVFNRFNETIQNNKISSVIFSDYNKGFLTKTLCKSIIKLCNKFNIPTIIDPKCDYTKYIDCTIIKPNRNETKNIFNIDLNNITLEDAHRSIHTMLNCKISVITLSGEGISAFKCDRHYRAIEDTKDVIDVTGAGDIVSAVLGTYYSFIDDTQQLINIANHLASISICHVGVYTINDMDLINTYKYIHNSKEITLDTLTKIQLKDIVFTNGCFDILHSAHIELFKFCKSLGKTVIVGLNSDNSIKRFKGNTRPINNVNERIKMLNAIDYIDFIIIFDDDTPINLIKNIKPDFLVKGGDYTIENIIGREFAKNTIIFNYINGLSTTNIIKQIKNL